jgi:hypothetical protein
VKNIAIPNNMPETAEKTFARNLGCFMIDYLQLSLSEWFTNLTTNGSRQKFECYRLAEIAA